jgi:O-acetylserine/cysteine efflux transporter
VFALQHFPPLLMASLRFTLIAVPTLLLVPRPQVALRWLIGVGVGIGLLQFAFLYLGMAAGMPGGLASLVLQASAPFTVLIAGIWLRERISKRQLIGIGVAVAGLAVIAVHRAHVAALLPVVLTLCAALGWAIGNICSRQAAAPKPFHLTLWMSVVPPVPLLVLSLLFEGPNRIVASLRTITTAAALAPVLGLLYIVVIATLLGYGLWNWLLSHHPSSVVAPFSMLVPVVGVLSSWLVFGEVIDTVELIAGVLVILGVLFASRPARRAPAVPTEEPAAPPIATAERI